MFGKAIAIFLMAILALSQAAPNPKVHPKLLSNLKQSSVSNIIVDFVGSNERALETIQTRVFLTRMEKIASVKATLEHHAESSQKQVQGFLNSKSIGFTSFWISNQLSIREATIDVIEALAAFPDVEQIRLPAQGQFLGGESTKVFLPNKLQEPEPQWNVKIIEAHRAWNYTNGTGVLIGVIDSGVRHTHEAIRSNFVGIEYGWYDPITKAPTPSDWLGHGTHVIGIAAGSKGFGVAPGSQWMTCQSCPDFGNCDETGFLLCSEWIVCPTKPDGSSPDCSKAPALVSNSWGFGPGETAFEPAIRSWLEAGIVPIFAIGNEGHSCVKGRSPGDSPNVIAVGSTTNEDALSSFSSTGPAYANSSLLKPDISAPGSDILSSSALGDDEYELMSGTSMACPSLAGTVGLLLSANQNLTVAQIKGILYNEGVDTSLNSLNEQCGGIPDNVFPNNHYGHGRVNALKVVQAALKQA